MSADNFWVVRKDKFGHFAAIMGFASNEEEPTIRPRDPRYETVEEALHSIQDEWSEYGTSVHGECYVDEIPTPDKRDGHYLECPQSLPKSYWDDDEYVCKCASILEGWNTYVPSTTMERKRYIKLGENA